MILVPFVEHGTDMIIVVAGMSTDTGHNSTFYDGSWGGPHNDVCRAYPHLEGLCESCIQNAIVDWAFRAMHKSVVAGKEVISRYYQQAAKKSYYLGCSAGGSLGRAYDVVRFLTFHTNRR